mgnify:FL=1
MQTNCKAKPFAEHSRFGMKLRRKRHMLRKCSVVQQIHVGVLVFYSDTQSLARDIAARHLERLFRAHA